MRNSAIAMRAALSIVAIGSSAIPAAASGHYQYLLGEPCVSAIVADPVANAALDGTQPYINIGTVKSPPGSPAAFPARPPSVPPAWHAIFIYRWASERQMEVDMPHVPSWIAGCMYDNEKAQMEPMTPTDETAAPVPFYAKAAALCHKAGKLFIASAGLGRGPGAQNDTFSTANQWDAYSMQTQTGETDLAHFSKAIAFFARRVRASNPNAKLIVGVGDFAHGTLVSASGIEAAIQAVPPGMAIWMNFGRHAGPMCRDSSVCPIPPRPDLLVRVIDDLAR